MVGHTVVLVVGPHDLTTTSLVAALRAHRLPVQEWNDRSALPNASGSGHLAVFTAPGPLGLVEKAVGCGWRVAVVVGASDARRSAAAVAEGAAAVVPRTAPLDRLLDVLADLAAGGPGMPDDERRALLAVHRLVQMRADARRRQLDALTDREFEVLQRLERGQRAADIAQEAVVATSTVRSHIRSILEKLDVHSQRQAVEVYREARGG